MKIISIISENKQTNEGPIRNIMPAFTKTQKLRKSAGRAAAGATKGEVRQMEAELLTYMEYSGQKTATPQVLKNYFKQKGLAKVGAEVVDTFQSKARKKATATNPGDATAGLGGPPPAPPTGAPPAPPTGAPPIPEVTNFGTLPFTKREVRSIITQVVQKAYGGAAGFGQSRFAEPAQGGGGGGAGLPDITSFVNSLTPQQKAQLKAAL